MKQLRFDSMRDFRPPVPTIKDEAVARRIAERIVVAVNLDDFYWEPNEVTEVILDVAAEIMHAGDPPYVFWRLNRKSGPQEKNGSEFTKPYGHPGINEHCRLIGKDIATEELDAAIKRYSERYS